MPEHAEYRISSDYINHVSKNKIFTSIYEVEKGNIPKRMEGIDEFSIKSESKGKLLKVRVNC